MELEGVSVRRGGVVVVFSAHKMKHNFVVKYNDGFQYKRHVMTEAEKMVKQLEAEKAATDTKLVQLEAKLQQLLPKGVAGAEAAAAAKAEDNWLSDATATSGRIVAIGAATVAGAAMAATGVVAGRWLMRSLFGLDVNGAPVQDVTPSV